MKTWSIHKYLSFRFLDVSSIASGIANGISRRAEDVTEELQNMMLQHASIDMFVQ